ncbi:hypothetical protein AURDEDRAFT_86895 [Auricularia subglabra TFB-10046 SS5]|nr:hypothetical protein AURDEDRAFT_86895 [Auricularia subglabra TFB-10046 SS5]
MTVTLVAVLLVQLLFTSQYHWPLARLNFIFQMLGVCTLLISIVTELSIVLSQSYRKSREWPYMLSYIASKIPPDDDDPDPVVVPWTLTQKLLWSIMEAAVSAFVHIANIQYLTLLYPSKLERYVVFIALVPIAFVSAAMEIFAVHPSDDVQAFADLLRNICNCTLSLLFTIALCMWGFVFNRRAAWRTDGGTAVFGAGAILLAAISSFLNIIVIPEKNRLFWLQPLVWSVVLWQSFLGWWWWVGCAVEQNNIEDIILRERKRAIRRSRTRSKKTDPHTTSTSSASGLKTGMHRVVGSLRSRGTRPHADGTNALHRTETIEMSDMAIQRTASVSAPPSVVSIERPWWRRLWRALRREHESATFVQALELTGAASDPPRRGWGLGYFAVSERDAASRMVRELRESGEARGLVGGHDHLDPSSIAGSSRHESDGAPTMQSNPSQDSRSSVLWWGPLSKWRHQDRTVYR